VPLAALQHPIAHSAVPGLDALIPAALSRAPTLPSSVPFVPDGAKPVVFDKPLLKTVEMRLTLVPVVVNSAIWADT
jgi:hypothetical protein